MEDIIYVKDNSPGALLKIMFRIIIFSKQSLSVEDFKDFISDVNKLVNDNEDLDYMLIVEITEKLLMTLGKYDIKEWEG